MSWNRIQRLNSWVLALLSLALVGCQLASDSDSSQTLEVEARQEILIVYMGGFNSCINSSPDELWAAAEYKRIKEELGAFNINVHWVMSCYDGMVSRLIRWKSCDEEDQVYAALWDRPHDDGQLWQEIAARSDNFQRKVFMIGHSYGGWLASHFAANLARHHGGAKKVEKVFSIDPVSPYHCNQVSYGSAILSGLIGRTGGDCQMAPPQYLVADDTLYPDSILNNEAAKISDYIVAGTNSWTNFYQQRGYLHSSAVENGFTENIEIRYEGRDGIFVVGTNSMPHIRIHNEPAVWQRIREEIYRSVGFLGSDFSLSSPNVITVRPVDPPPPALLQPVPGAESARAEAFAAPAARAMRQPPEPPRPKSQTHSPHTHD